MELLVGQSLGRYEITGYLGAGGMGAVYRARDSQLDREVAIKVLPDVREDPLHLEHFRREATIVAKLSHPNILEIHDFGFDHEQPYAVMELLDGKDLHSHMQGRPLPVDKATDIAIAVAEGLAAAHNRGVVHRDIKPENIFITSSGVVKILDFGIARPGRDPEAAADELSDEVTLTRTGAIVGTASYMAPEQIRGRKVDGRTDIFALGCVLYEMLSGRHPFRRNNSIDTMLAIVEDPAPPLAETTAGLPPALAMIVHRCLEKEPDDRFDSARDVSFALRAMSHHGMVLPSRRPSVSRRFKRLAPKVVAVGAVVALAVLLGAKLTDLWPSPAPVLPQVAHLAVLPFGTVSGDPETTQFAVGLSQTIADDLEWVARQACNDCWVVPSASIRAGDSVDVDSVYRRDNVNITLTGVAERRGPLLHLELSSVEPKTGIVFRKIGYDADLGNVSSLQIDPLARAAALVGVDFTPEVREHFAARATNVSRAFELFVRARGVMAASPDEDDTDAAVEMLDEATSLDPLFNPAREALAQALALKFDVTDDRAFFDRSIEELQRLVRSGPTVRAHRIMAALYMSDGAHREAAAALERAVELAPNNGEAYQELGAAYQKLGRIDDAERAYQRSANLRPGYWKAPDSLGRMYLGDGRYDAAANAFRQVIECAPLNRVGYNVLGVVQFLQNDLEASRTTFERSIEAAPEDNYFAYANLGTLHFNAARFADAIGVYEQALAISDGDYQVWGNLAFAYAFGAEPERAKEPFARAIEIAEGLRENDPENAKLLADLAGYYAMVDRPDASRDLLEQVIAIEPNDPQIFAKVGETYEDLKDREAALEWIARALDGGIRPRFFESRPMLRDLVADPRYRRLVDGTSSSPE